MPFMLYLLLHLPSLAQDVHDTLIIHHCKSLPRYRACLYIQTLGTRDNRRVLRKIYMAEDLLDSSYAAFIAAKTYGDDEIVQFYRQFKVDSANWVAVFDTLQDRPKARVIAYIDEVCKTSDAQTRYHCYRVCLAKSWGDLLKYAQADHDNTTIVDTVFGGVALSEEAGFYVEEFDKKKNDE
jgi:hypothetical protein